MLPRPRANWACGQIVASKSILFSRPTAAWQFAQENISVFEVGQITLLKLGRRLAGICCVFTLFALLAAALQATRGKNISGVGTIFCEKLTVRLLWDLGLFALATAWQIARKKELGAKIISWKCGEGFVSPVLGCLTGCRFTLALVVGWWRSLGSFQLEQ